MISLSGPRTAILQAVAALPQFRASPSRVSGTGSSAIIDNSVNWVSELSNTQDNQTIWWGNSGADDERLVSFVSKFETIRFSSHEPFASDEAVIALLESLPFTVATVGDDDELGVATDSFWFPGHIALGWGVALRGAGHDILMSRRWLSMGPWKVIKKPSDLSVLQVYSIGDSAQMAAQQIEKACESLFWPNGAEVTRNAAPVKGLYTADTRTFEIVVPPLGNVSLDLMNSARALRRHEGIEPIEHVAFVFIDKETALRHLRDLWLRELEVWHVDNNGRHRLDDTYSIDSSAD